MAIAAPTPEPEPPPAVPPFPLGDPEEVAADAGLDALDAVLPGVAA